ncbi:hypothetical protein C8J56DRAFT_956333 [Mycena floridula]|nr:hypothetical protein C8J56DRAFT_956333 [Mycena floridula]
MGMICCYYCCKQFQASEAKRCARCRLVTYCSKECQKISWKLSHKDICKVHPSLLASPDSDRLRQKSEIDKSSRAVVDLAIDTGLSRWLKQWRRCFCTWATICLDLANHPPQRVFTHCMQLVVQPTVFQNDHTKSYEVTDARVVPLADILATFPDLQVPVDPTDLTRLRFVVIMEMENETTKEVRRIRLVQWNDLAIDQWRRMNKTASAELGGDSNDSQWSRSLRHCVSHLRPKDVENNWGSRNR